MNTRKHVKRFLSLLITVILAIGVMPAKAFADADTDRPGRSMAEYQAVVDKVNKEYGTEWFFINQEAVDQITENLINSYGYLPFAPPKVVTLEVLQQYTLAEIEAEIIANINGYSILAHRQSSD